MQSQSKVAGSRAKVVDSGGGKESLGRNGSTKGMKDKPAKGGGSGSGSKAKGAQESSSSGGPPPNVAATVANAPAHPINAAVVQPDVGICFDFTKGRCQRGAVCRFSHDPKKIEAAAAADKNGICFDFTRGQCNRGASCRFSHDLNLLNQQSSNRSSGICFDFINGKCQRGAACRFSHDMSSAQTQAAATKSNGVCFDFTKGRCQRGAACRFSHDMSLVANGTTAMPMGVPMPGGPGPTQPQPPVPNGMPGAPPLPAPSAQQASGMMSSGFGPPNPPVPGAAPRDSPANFASVAAAHPAGPKSHVGFNQNGMAAVQVPGSSKMYSAPQDQVPNFAAAVGGQYGSQQMATREEAAFSASGASPDGLSANVRAGALQSYGSAESDAYQQVPPARQKSIENMVHASGLHSKHLFAQAQTDPSKPPPKSAQMPSNGRDAVAGSGPGQSAEVYSRVPGQNVPDLRKPLTMAAALNGAVQAMPLGQPPLPEAMMQQQRLRGQQNVRPPQAFHPQHFLYHQQQQQYEQQDRLVPHAVSQPGFPDLPRQGSLSGHSMAHGANGQASPYPMHNGQGMQQDQSFQQQPQQSQPTKQPYESQPSQQPHSAQQPQQQMGASDVVNVPLQPRHGSPDSQEQKPLAPAPQQGLGDMGGLPPAYVSMLGKYSGNFSQGTAGMAQFQAQGQSPWQGRMDIPGMRPNGSGEALNALPGLGAHKLPDLGEEQKQTRNGLSSQMQGLMLGQRQASEEATSKFSTGGPAPLEKVDVPGVVQPKYEHVWSKPSLQGAREMNGERSPSRDSFPELTAITAPDVAGWQMSHAAGKVQPGDKQPWGPATSAQQPGKNQKSGWGNPTDTVQIKSANFSSDPSILQPPLDALRHASDQPGPLSNSGAQANYWGGSLFSMRFEDGEQTQRTLAQNVDRWNIWSA
mmetsp:Transcript_7006/g.25833  ORF Transcript_7006/g.25833 Transcript_7006/m.25833 type:complete len:917 (-) Transcript_7006:908-3658(-)